MASRRERRQDSRQWADLYRVRDKPPSFPRKRQPQAAGGEDVNEQRGHGRVAAAFLYVELGLSKTDRRVAHVRFGSVADGCPWSAVDSCRTLNGRVRP